MSTNKCPPNNDDCVESGWPGGFESAEPPCDHIGGLPCFYFYDDEGDPRDVSGLTHCEIDTFDTEVTNQDPPCQRQFPGWYSTQFNTGHWVRFADSVVSFMRAYLGVANFLNRDGPFRSRHPATYVMVFDPAALLEIDACCTERPGNTLTTWIGTTRIMGGGIAWDAWCNIAGRVSISDDWPGTPPPNGDPRWCRQSFFRALRKPGGIQLPADQGGTSFSGAAQMAFTTLGVVSIMPSLAKTACFPYENHYCFTRYCGAHPNGIPGLTYSATDDRKFHCMDEDGQPREDSEIGIATETLDITYAMALSTDEAAFPHANTYDIHIKNAMLDFFTRKSSGEVGHGIGASEPKSFTPFLFSKTEVWDDGHPDGVEYPVLTYPSAGSSVYPTLSHLGDKPFPIVGRSLLTGIEYPMELRLSFAMTRLELYIEKLFNSRGGGFESFSHRMFADAHVSVFFHLWLKPEAYEIEGPLRFLSNATEPWDHRFAHPNNPGVVYPYEQLVITGPNGERVPTHVSWKGRRCEAPVAAGTSFEHACVTWYDSYPEDNGLECCSALHTLEASPIYGQHTNINDIEAAQMYAGHVVLGVPGLHDSSTPSELFLDCGCMD